MGLHRARNVAAASVAAAIILLLPHASAGAVVVDFSGFAPGTVLAGDGPAGPVAGTILSGFTMSCTRAGDGPHAALVFDSKAPTGGDEDLGTPNVDFGGPGIGLGGGFGAGGANDRAYGNLVVVAESLLDTDGDGLVDAPEDAGGGGTLAFAFDEPVTVAHVVLVDVDANETASVRLYRGEALAVEIAAAALGNNSVQKLIARFYPGISRMEIVFSGSGGLAEFAYAPQSTPVETTRWGATASAYPE